jgi:hypothetical protein
MDPENSYKICQNAHSCVNSMTAQCNATAAKWSVGAGRQTSDVLGRQKRQENLSTTPSKYFGNVVVKPLTFSTSAIR